MAKIQHIDSNDTLNEGRVKLNEFAIDPALRAEENSNQAIGIAINSQNIAKESDEKADNIQSQLNVLVVDGDSSVEAAQARVGIDGKVYQTLQDRLNNEINNLKNRKETINVLDLGLKNDGSEDVTSKLRQYIESAGNDISLFFPAGIYKMTNNLLIDKKMTIKGVKPRYDNGNLTAGTVFSGGGFYFRNGSNGTVIDSVGIDATKGANGFDIRGGVKDVLISNVLTIAKEHCYLFESYTGVVDNIRVVNSESYDAIHGFISKAANIIFDGCAANNHASWGFGLISDNIQGANKLAEAINNKVNNCTAKNCGAGYMQYKRNYFADDSNALKNTNNQLIGINAIKCTIPIRVGDSPGDTGGGKYVSYPVDNTSISNFTESESTQSAQFYQSTNLIINSATLSRDAVATNQANKNIIASNYVGGTIGYVNDLQAISGAAPSLKFGKTFITKNTSATIITDFVDAIDGEIYEIMLFDRFTTIQSSKTIALNFGTVSDRGSSVRFKYQDGVFFEISRANAPRKSINARLENVQSFEIGNAEVLDLVANAGTVSNGIKITDAASNKSLLTIVVRIGSSGTLYYSFDASQFVLPEGIKTEVTGFGNAQVFVWAYIQALNKYVLVSSRDTKIN